METAIGKGKGWDTSCDRNLKGLTNCQCLFKIVSATFGIGLSMPKGLDGEI